VSIIHCIMFTLFKKTMVLWLFAGTFALTLTAGFLPPATDVSAAGKRIVPNGQPLTYQDFKDVGIPDSTFYVPSTGTLNSSVSNNCVRPESKGDSKGRLGNVTEGDTSAYGTGRDTSQSAYFCFFRSDKHDECDAETFIYLFNSPEYKKSSDIIPNDPDVQACIQFVRAGDRCLVDNINIGAVAGRPSPITVRTDNGKSRQVYVAYLSPATFGGVISSNFYCDLQGNSDALIANQGGIINSIDARCQGNPYLIVSGVQTCLRGAYVSVGQQNGLLPGAITNGTNGDATRTTGLATTTDARCQAAPNTEINGTPVCKNGVYVADVFGLDAATAQQATTTAQSKTAGGQNAILTEDWSTFGKCPPLDVFCVIKTFFAGLGVGFLKLVMGAIAFVLGLIILGLKFFAKIEADVINAVLLINPASDQFIGISQSVVGIIQGIAYLLILVVIAGIGLNYIIGNKQGKSDISNVVLNIAVMAIGIQFSFFGVAALIALSYQIGYVFSSGIISAVPAFNDGTVLNVQNLFTAFSDSLLKGFNFPDNVLGKVTQIFSSGWGSNLSDGFSVFIEFLVMLVILGYMVYVFWRLLMTLGMRVIVLFMLLVSAPVGFILWISQYPAFKKEGQKWASTAAAYILSYLFIMVGMSLMIIIIIKFNNAMDGYYVGFVSNKSTNTNAADSGLTDNLIQTYIPIFLKMAIALGALNMYSEYVEKSLMPMTSQAISAFNKARSGTTAFAKRSLSNIKTAGRMGLKTASFLRGGSVAGASVVSRGVGNVRAAITGAGVNRSASAGQQALQRLSLLSGRSATDWKTARVSTTNGSTGMRSSAQTGYAYGKNAVENSPVGRKIASLTMRSKGTTAFNNARGAAQTEINMRQNAVTEDDIALADKFAEDNKLGTEFRGMGKKQMKLLTPNQLNTYVSRAGSRARLAVMRTKDSKDLAMEESLQVLEDEYNAALKEAAGPDGDVDSLTTAQKNAIGAKIMFDGNGKAAVQRAVESIGQGFDQNAAGIVRDSKGLSEFFGLEGAQSKLIETNQGKKQFRKIYGRGTMFDKIHEGVFNEEMVSKHRDAEIKGALSNPGSVAREILSNPRVAEEVTTAIMKRNMPIKKKVEILQGLGLSTYMQSDTIKTSREEIQKMVDNGVITAAQGKEAEKAVVALAQKGYLDPQDLQDLYQHYAGGGNANSIQELLRQKFGTKINDTQAAEVLREVKTFTGTDEELGKKLANILRPQGEAPILEESRINGLRTSLAAATTDEAKSNVVKEYAKNLSGVDIDDATAKKAVVEATKYMVTNTSTTGGPVGADKVFGTDVAHVLKARGDAPVLQDAMVAALRAKMVSTVGVEQKAAVVKEQIQKNVSGGQIDEPTAEKVAQVASQYIAENTTDEGTYTGTDNDLESKIVAALGTVATTMSAANKQSLAEGIREELVRLGDKEHKEQIVKAQAWAQGTGVDMNEVVKRKSVREVLDGALLSQLSSDNHDDIVIGAGSSEIKFSRDHAVAVLQKNIETQTAKVADVGEKENLRRQLMGQYFGDADINATPAVLKQSIQEGGFKKYVGLVKEEKLTTAAEQQSFYQAAVSSPLASGFAPVLAHQISNAIRTPNELAFETIEQGMNSDTAQAVTNKLLKELIEASKNNRANGSGVNILGESYESGMHTQTFDTVRLDDTQVAAERKQIEGKTQTAFDETKQKVTADYEQQKKQLDEDLNDTVSLPEIGDLDIAEATKKHETKLKTIEDARNKAIEDAEKTRDTALEDTKRKLSTPQEILQKIAEEDTADKTRLDTAYQAKQEALNQAHQRELESVKTARANRDDQDRINNTARDETSIKTSRDRDDQETQRTQDSARAKLAQERNDEETRIAANRKNEREADRRDREAARTRTTQTPFSGSSSGGGSNIRTTGGGASSTVPATGGNGDITEVREVLNRTDATVTPVVGTDDRFVAPAPVNQTIPTTVPVNTPTTTNNTRTTIVAAGAQQPNMTNVSLDGDSLKKLAGILDSGNKVTASRFEELRKTFSNLENATNVGNDLAKTEYQMKQQQMRNQYGPAARGNGGLITKPISGTPGGDGGNNTSTNIFTQTKSDAKIAFTTAPPIKITEEPTTPTPPVTPPNN
jgi:hypothetical protein